jgi:Zn-dependent protease
MRMWVKLPRFYRAFVLAGIPVNLHWSTAAMFGGLLVASILFGVPWIAAAFALFTIMIWHELGHAMIARRLGYPIIGITLFPLLGQCHYQQPYSAFEDAMIAWGGVIAQLIVLVPAVLVLVFFGNTSSGIVNLFLIVFTLCQRRNDPDQSCAVPWA